MLSVQPHRVQGEIQLLIKRLIQCLYSPERQIFTETEDLLDALIDLLKPISILQCLITGMQEEQDAPTLPVIIRLTTKAVKLSEKSKIMQFLPELTQVLFQRFNHLNADVRKSVVFCLVELNQKIGEVFSPYLQQLTQSQFKLVEIYIKRRQAVQEQ